LSQSARAQKPFAIKIRVLIYENNQISHFLRGGTVFFGGNDFCGCDEVLFRHIFERLSGFFDGDTVGEG